MESPWQDQNPYSTPSAHGSSNYGGGPPPKPQVNGKVLAPAVALLVASILGLCLSLFNVGFAIINPKRPIDPNAPPFLQEMQKNSGGPVAAVIQGAFVVVNAVIILGAIQMMRMKSWGLALTSSILAMVNFGTCCCILGLPFGIWSVIILSMADVKQAFAAQAAGPRSFGGQ